MLECGRDAKKQYAKGAGEPEDLWPTRRGCRVRRVGRLPASGFLKDHLMTPGEAVG